MVRRAGPAHESRGPEWPMLFRRDRRSGRTAYKSGTGGTYTTPNCAAPAGSPAARAGAQCIVTVPDGYGTINNVTPQFSSVALQDEFRPTDRWDHQRRRTVRKLRLPTSANGESGDELLVRAGPERLLLRPGFRTADFAPGLAGHPAGKRGTTGPAERARQRRDARPLLLLAGTSVHLAVGSASPPS